MISDKERRRIANELREAASAKGKRSGSMELMLSKLLGIAKQDRGVFGQPVDVAATWRDVYRSLADLIDRPTCKTIEHGRPDEFHVCKSCSRCSYGWFEDIYDKPYSYCPNCGAEVTT